LEKIETPLDGYCRGYDILVEDILAGIEEGFKEGLKEGIKQGFIAGIIEFKSTGFEDIDVKSTDEILKDSFKQGSDAATFTTIKQTVTNEYRVTIGTVFKKEMEKACEKAVMNIRNADVTLDKVSAFELKLSLKESIKKSGRASVILVKRLEKKSLQTWFLEAFSKVCKMA
jgi:hypothetical protein